MPSSRKHCSCCKMNVRAFIHIQGADGKNYSVIVCPNCDADANHPLARKIK